MPNKIPQCPECKSANVVFREGDKTLLCRRCGHRFPKQTTEMLIADTKKLLRDHRSKKEG